MNYTKIDIVIPVRLSDWFGELITRLPIFAVNRFLKSSICSVVLINLLGNICIKMSD